MKNSAINLETLSPLAEAEREHLEKWEAYRETLAALRAVVDEIEERQQSDADKIAGMLAELEDEEQKLRQATREQAEARALCRITGQEPPRNDFSAGARLAAIPEEKAALEALRGRRAITDQEQERYDAALEVAQDATMKSSKATAVYAHSLEIAFSTLNAAKDRLADFQAIPNPYSGIADAQDRLYRLSTSPDDESEGVAYETPYGILRGGRRV